MEDSRNFKFTNRVIIVPICAIVLIWMVYWVEITFNYNFNNYGILPQKIRGLKGVFFSPFIHGSTSHLFNNSVPLFILLGFLFFFYRIVAFKVLVVGTILTGILTWTYARNSYHIGASGVIYLLFSFIFLFMQRHPNQNSGNSWTWWL